MKILIIALLIAFIGILSIYSSTYQAHNKLWQQQFVWLIIGAAAFLAVSNYDYRRILGWTYFFYAACILLLLVVCIMGAVRMGAQRWIRIGAFGLQPAELAKLITVIFLSRYFSTKSAGQLSLGANRLGLVRGFFMPMLFAAIPAGLIIEQPDLGSGMLVILLSLAICYVAGTRIKAMLIFLAGGICLSPFLLRMLHGYQRDRLLVFLNPNIDPLGAGYTLIQSKIAIGSGGFFGRGWLLGTQSQLRFLPESHTDFIFATLAEEWGFAGCLVLLLLFYLLVREGFSIAQKTNDHFARLLASGLTLMIALQICVNIAMTMGLMPVVGVPLPLMSYGGSSMFITFVALGILASIEKRRAVF